MKVNPYFHNWWFIAPDRAKPFRMAAGEEYDITWLRGPYKTRSEASEARFYDFLPEYWAGNMTVWADHCPKCGRFAKVLAFDNMQYWSWRVTECSSCGIIDSRFLPYLKTGE